VGRVSARDTKLYSRLASHIRSLIEEGQLRPGDKLPPLTELALQFQCSRTTVREALGSLRGQGLIDVRHGDGTYVRTATVEMWMEPLDAALLLGASQVAHLIELQTTILAGLAGAVAARITTGGQTELAKSLFEVECAMPYSEQSAATELTFYDLLAQLSENPLLANALRVLQEASRSILRVVSSRSRIGLDNCRAVYDAIQAGDEQAARNCIYRYGAAVNAAMLESKDSL